MLEGGAACETDFANCEDEECDVEIAGAKVPLQRIQLTIPQGAQDVGGITFVLRRCGPAALHVLVLPFSAGDTTGDTTADTVTPVACSGGT